MPVLPCQDDGKSGFKWGEGGVCFTGPDARARAETVGRAIEARRARDKTVGKVEVVLIEEEISKFSKPELDAALEILAPVDEGDPAEFHAELEIRKLDDEQRIAFGFASIVEKDGQEVLDLEDDVIPIEELELAAYEWLEKSREGSRMHQPRGQAHAVESFVITREKAEAMRAGGVLKGDFSAAGWWVGFRVTDDATWSQIKRGELPMLSIGGIAQRVMEEG